MVDIRKALTGELEAVTLDRQRKVAEHRQSATKLAQMAGSSEPSQYQLSV